jgi:hypothetical protein
LSSTGMAWLKEKSALPLCGGTGTLQRQAGRRCQVFGKRKCACGSSVVKNLRSGNRSSIQGGRCRRIPELVLETVWRLVWHRAQTHNFSGEQAARCLR